MAAAEPATSTIRLVYRREAGGEPVKQDVTLQPGKRYPFKISGFQGDPPRFWMQKMDLLGYGDLEAAGIGELTAMMKDFMSERRTEGEHANAVLDTMQQTIT